MTPASRPTTPLRQRMIEDMKLRNLSPHTIQAYVDRVAAFAKHFGKSPQLLGPKEVRAYLVFLVEEKRVSWSYYGQAICRPPIPLPRDSRQGLGCEGRRLSQEGDEAPSHPEPRRGRAVPRSDHQPQASCHPHDGLRRRAPRLGGRGPAGRRHR